MKKWIMLKNDANLDLMCQVLKIDKIVANFLANRGIRTKNTAIKFLNPCAKFLHDISLMKDINKGISLIEDAIANKNKITVYGDYDVDGVMGTVILVKSLKKLGADVNFYLPSRFKDGFGLNKCAVKKLHDNGTKLILTCDNGIAAIDEIEYAKKLGMKVLIIDHHFPNYNELGEDILPNADAIIDNKQSDCNYPFKMLCAATMAYKFAEKLYAIKNLFLDDDFLIFASIATLCDIVPLTDENRIIAKYGLDLLNQRKLNNTGLISLLKLNKIYNRQINSDDIGFIIGPCINACGRMKTADLAAELFLTENNDEAKFFALEVCELNSERKSMTKAACEEIFNKLGGYDFTKNPVAIFYDNNVDESIAGIIAGKIKEKFGHPTIFFTDSSENGIIKGSARSINSYDMFDQLQQCRNLFTKFGGHKMAAGLSMKKENLMPFIEQLNSNCNLTQKDFVQEIYIDNEIGFDKINFDLLEKKNLLAPFGHKNREPLFLTKNVKLEKANVIEEKNTIIMSLSQNNIVLKAICFGMCDNFTQQLLDKYTECECKKILDGFIDDIDIKLDIVYSIQVNDFNKEISLQLRLNDFAVI